MTTPYQQFIRVIFVMMFFGLTGCNGSNQETVATESWTLTQIRTQDENLEAVSETVEVKYCTQPESKSITCPAGEADGFGYDLGVTHMVQADISPAVSGTLGFANRGERLAFEVPPQGSFYRYDIIKVYRMVRGDVAVQSSTGQEDTAFYAFRAACFISVQARERFDCNTGAKIVESDPTSIPPNASPTPRSAFTPTPTPTLVPGASPSPSSTPTPTPSSTPTPPAMGQNCNLNPAPVFATLWQARRHLIGCPVSNPTTIPTIAEEAFEGGHLFWRKDTDQVYIISDRTKSGRDLNTGKWLTNPAWKWDNSDPDGIGLSPPSGLVEPKRGFGWLWRTHLGREDGPFGWALDREYGFDNIGQSQSFKAGLMFKGSGGKVYLLLKDGRFFAR